MSSIHGLVNCIMESLITPVEFKVSKIEKGYSASCLKHFLRTLESQPLFHRLGYLVKLVSAFQYS
eukprot:snap_masked-scaffold_17-processed-gene-0.11-mRNA-1 protein AED:1.00 eAED:1.00 QI:0/0/0/0/1/1/2/0/64